MKSIVGGPTAKSFNLNFANVYDEIAAQRVRPSNLYCADDEAREVTEQLIRDARATTPVDAGGLEQRAACSRTTSRCCSRVSEAGLGPFFYRYAQPRRALS